MNHNIPAGLLNPDGSMPNSVADVMQLSALRLGCTLDIWIDKKHYRLRDAHFEVQGLSIKTQVLGSIQRRIQGMWQPFKGYLDFHLEPKAPTVAMYDAAGNLLCYTATHVLRGGKEFVQFAFYPKDYELTSRTLQVVGWINQYSPRLDIPTKKYKLH